MFFNDRVDAGKRLGDALLSYRGKDPVVYALPRGGAVVGAEVARALNAPLDLIMARKIGHPSHDEYAIAAVDADGYLVANAAEVNSIDPQWFERQVRLQQLEALRRRDLYIGDREPIRATGKTAIIVDDGIATGLTMFAAIKRVRAENPARLVVAVPVAPRDTVIRLESEVDDVIALYMPEPFRAIGLFYRDFEQVTDEEVVRLMSVANNPRAA